MLPPAELNDKIGLCLIDQATVAANLRISMSARPQVAASWNTAWKYCLHSLASAAQ